jgi:hypothetical protein
MRATAGAATAAGLLLVTGLVVRAGADGESPAGIGPELRAGSIPSAYASLIT